MQEEEADVITNGYTIYIDEVVSKDKSKYSDLQSSPNSAGDTDRIEVLFYNTMSSNKAFSKLWQVKFWYCPMDRQKWNVVALWFLLDFKTCASQ